MKLYVIKRIITPNELLENRNLRWVKLNEPCYVGMIIDNKPYYISDITKAYSAFSYEYAMMLKESLEQHIYQIITIDR